MVRGHKDTASEKINSIIATLQNEEPVSERDFKFLFRVIVRAIKGEDEEGSQGKLAILPLGVFSDGAYSQSTPAGAGMRKRSNSFDYGVVWASTKMFFGLAYMSQNFNKDRLKPLSEEHYEFVNKLIMQLREKKISQISWNQYRELIGWTNRIICGEKKGDDERRFEYISLKVNEIVRASHFEFDMTPKNVAFDLGAAWAITQIKIEMQKG